MEGHRAGADACIERVHGELNRLACDDGPVMLDTKVMLGAVLHIGLIGGAMQLFKALNERAEKNETKGKEK